MANVGLVMLASLVVAYALFSNRLSKTAFTGPMLFMVFGLSWSLACSPVHPCSTG